MSHVVKVKTQVKDEKIVEMTCTSLKLQAPVRGRHHLFERDVEGLGVRLNNWKYPVVFDLKNGEAAYDNYNGSWGNPANLDRFTQEYAAQTTRQTMAEQGMYVEEQQTLPDGSLRLRIPVYA